MKTLSRRAWTVAVAGAALSSGWAQTPPRLGVLMLHGKNPGSPDNPGLVPMRSALERQGWEVLLPDMPWSRRRYLEGDWNQAMAEIAGHVRTLKTMGADKVVLMGHSMGCPAALGYAARGGEVDALVLLAPGHTPMGYYHVPRLSPVRESIDRARALVKAGKGDETERFQDINQGRQQTVVTTARHFLSYFDPESEAEMGVTAPRVPVGVPVLTVIGERDPLFASARSYFVDKLPAHPATKYLEVAGGHLDTPRLAADQVVAWLKSSW